MAQQWIADLYGCDCEILNDAQAIRKIAAAAVRKLGAEIVAECVHPFEPIGITYFAIISTSHFSVHTWPECGYAAVDVFSCSESVAEGISDMLKRAFRADEIRINVIERRVGS